MAVWYLSSTAWTAVPQWAATTAYNIGDIRRNTGAASTTSRVFRCTTAGTSGGTQPTWNNGVGTTTNDNTVVWTEITGSSTYNSPNNWAAPHAFLQNIWGSWGGFAVADIIYVADDHAQTQITSLALTSPGTATFPAQVICIDRTQATPTPTTGASISTTTNANANITFTGYTHFFGITFNVGSSSNVASFEIDNTNSTGHTFENCVISLGNTNTSSRISTGNSGTTMNVALVTLINTRINFSNVSQGITPRGTLFWKNTSPALSGSVPTALIIVPSDGNIGTNHFYGLDLSTMGSGKSLVSGSANCTTILTVENCKLGASVSVIASSLAAPGAAYIRLVNCDSADTNYRYAKVVRSGSIVHQTTIIRTGGATDGVTPISLKMVADGTRASFSVPLETDPFYYWNTNLSPTTIEVEVISDNVTFTDAELWVEVEYLGTSGFPQSNFVSDRVASILATPANQDSSTVDWVTTGLTTPIKQKLSVTFTPAEVGYIKARVFLAKASTTVYVCPDILPNAPSGYMTPCGYAINNLIGPIGRANVIQNIGTY